MLNSKLLLLSWLILFSFPSLAESRYIQVNGEESIAVWPDFIQLQLNINHTATTNAEAKAAVDKSIQALIKLSQQLGVKEKDIQAERIISQPQYEWRESGQVLLGQQVSRNITLKLSPDQQYTNFTHQALAIKHVQLVNSENGFNQPASLQLEATKLALQQAQHKAEVMAATLGAKVVKVLAIEEIGSSFRPRAVSLKAAMDSASTTPPMVFNQQQIYGHVRVKFEIK